MPDSRKTEARKPAGKNRAGAAVRALRERIRELERERDTYRKALYKLLPKERMRLTKKDIREMDHSGLTLDQVIKQLKSL